MHRHWYIKVTNDSGQPLDTLEPTFGWDVQFAGAKAETLFDSSGACKSSLGQTATVLPGKTYTHTAAYVGRGAARVPGGEGDLRRTGPNPQVRIGKQGSVRTRTGQSGRLVGKNLLVVDPRKGRSDFFP
jgi:hypothetical protein